jgi:hypothetical protein
MALLELARFPRQVAHPDLQLIAILPLEHSDLSESVMGTDVAVSLANFAGGSFLFA